MAFARVGNVHAAQHLADDHFDVLVGNLHALQTVNLLHFLHDVAGERFDALQAQDVVRIYRAVYNGFATVDHLAVVHQHLFFFRNQGFVGHAVYIGNHQALFAFGFFTEGYGTGNLGQHTGIFGCTRFKQLGHARQTTGNVAGFGGGLRNPRQHIALADFLPFAHGNHRAHRESHRHRRITTRHFHFFAVFVQQFHQGAQQFGLSGTAAFAVDNY